MSTIQPVGTDDFDLDQLLERYSRIKTKKIYLLIAMVLLFIGTAGTFFVIQESSQKLDKVTGTTIELAEAVVDSDICKKSPAADTCRKAEAVLKDPHNNGLQQNGTGTVALDVKLVP